MKSPTGGRRSACAARKTCPDLILSFPFRIFPSLVFPVMPELVRELQAVVAYLTFENTTMTTFLSCDSSLRIV